MTTDPVTEAELAAIHRNPWGWSTRLSDLEPGDRVEVKLDGRRVFGRVERCASPAGQPELVDDDGRTLMHPSRLAAYVEAGKARVIGPSPNTRAAFASAHGAPPPETFFDSEIVVRREYGPVYGTGLRWVCAVARLAPGGRVRWEAHSRVQWGYPTVKDYQVTGHEGGAGGWMKMLRDEFEALAAALADRESLCAEAVAAVERAGGK